MMYPRAPCKLQWKRNVRRSCYLFSTGVTEEMKTGMKKELDNFNKECKKTKNPSEAQKR